MDPTNIDTIVFDKYGLINPEFKKNKKWVKVTRIALQFIFSISIGELIFNAGAYAKLSFKAKKIEREIEQLPREQDRIRCKHDFVELKKVSNKKLIASAIRVGLVAVTVIAAVGTMIGGVMIGLAAGSHALAIGLGGVGGAIPIVALAFIDKKSFTGVADLPATFWMYSDPMLRIPLILIVDVAFRALNSYSYIIQNIQNKETWVDRTAAKWAGIQQ